MNFISHGNIQNAYNNIDKHMINKQAKAEFNILNNDGMTLKIIEDNFLDRITNRIDSRRILLEKKAEILHDYYGDRLLAKDVFKDYLSYKRFTSNVVTTASVALIGANLYSRVLKNSYLMGKVGTLLSIIGLQAYSRKLSNDWLEKHIDTPWKIHCNRMSKGLGPTNVPDNKHFEIHPSPLENFVFIS